MAKRVISETKETDRLYWHELLIDISRHDSSTTIHAIEKLQKEKIQLYDATWTEVSKHFSDKCHEDLVSLYRVCHQVSEASIFLLLLMKK